MGTFGIEGESQTVLTKIASECGVEFADVLAEAIGLLEMAYKEVKRGNEIYIVNKRGKALSAIKLNIAPK
jgi:hypothetical protein